MLIQLLARWPSEVVLRYVADAPLLTVTAGYRRRPEGYDLERLLTASTAELALIRGRLAELDDRTLALLAAERDLRAQIADAHTRPFQ